MPPSKSVSVDVRGLSLTYRSGLFGRTRVPALRDVDLALEPGQILGVVGPNGSGKSSLLRCLIGLEKPDRGEIRVLGAAAGAAAGRRRIGYVAEERLPLGRLTAWEFLTLAGTLAGMRLAPARQRTAELLARVGLGDVADRPHGAFSQGMERRLALADAVCHQPSLLLLDEPTSGLDPEGVELAQTLLREHREGGGSAVVATHELEDFGEGVLDRLLVLFEGRAIAAGTPPEVLADAERHEIRLSGVDTSRVRALVERLRRDGAVVERWGPARRSLDELFASLPRREEP